MSETVAQHIVVKTDKPFRGKISAVTLVDALQKNRHVPLTAMIEIADRCNEVCLHCYQIQGQKGEMNTEQVKKVIDDLADLGVLFLTLSGGEATLRDDFLELVAHARKRQFALKIFTNGLTMTRPLAQSLAELAVQEVQISLYSHQAEVHDDITGVKGSWQKTVQGIRHLVEAGVAVVMKTPIMRVNAVDYPHYRRLAAELGVHFSMDPGGLDPRENGDRGPELLAASESAIKVVLADPIMAQDLPIHREAQLSDPVCGACSGNVHIEANGDIRPCTQLDVSCGNALTDGVHESVSKNPVAQAIRGLTWGDIRGCRVCDLKNYCARCFARSLVEVGDALMPYASACQMAKIRYEVVHGVKPEIESLHPTRETGPYQRRAEHVFVTVDEATGEQAFVRDPNLYWTKKSQSIPLSSGLVQLRRPHESKRASHFATEQPTRKSIESLDNLDN